MVFFNYSTMQMAAKVVYYGPGLCGKTTNLQHIYGHTSGESRGEMVSLETETDRTLFFDLLPIDVGKIAGFKTRIQLYTVPGQVFYNTTRKLVLKGVDGVVFVADSQRPMLNANVESLNNLEENLAEIGLGLHEIPLVLQFNKRDLGDVCTVEEMNQALNRHGWPCFEASAITGEGVFETLKGISKMTLMHIKKKMQKGEGGVAPTPTSARPASQASQPAQPPATPPPATQTPATPPPATPPPAAKRPPAPAAKQPAPPQPEAAKPAAPANPTPVPPSRPSPQKQTPTTPAAQPAAAATAAAVETPPAKREVDILAELERIRRQATARPNPVTAGLLTTNGSGELNQEIARKIARSVFSRARTVKLTLQVEDDKNEILDAFNETVVVQKAEELEKLLLNLNISLEAE